MTGFVNFTNIVTNPRTQQEALEEVQSYFQAKQILKIYPVHAVIEKSFELLSSYNVTGQNVFDLYLVSTMLINNITFVLQIGRARGLTSTRCSSLVCYLHLPLPVMLYRPSTYHLQTDRN